jgi:hypothetical protein
MKTTMLVCPRHEGAYDCTPFCDVCEGNQEYVYTDTRPCQFCNTAVDHDTWFEELAMCLDCSNKYWSHDTRECDGCGLVTDAGDYPDWPNGECEKCDPQSNEEGEAK